MFEDLSGLKIICPKINSLISDKFLDLLKFYIDINNKPYIEIIFFNLAPKCDKKDKKKIRTVYTKTCSIK